jgi:ribonuclease HII
MARARVCFEETYSPSIARELELMAFGYSKIVGADEAGRGPLAGPVVAAAVHLPPDFCCDEWADVNDSKQISHEVREELFCRITSTFAFGVGIIDAPMIDQINIRQASWHAMQLAVADLQANHSVSVDYVLLDGLPYGPGPWPYEALVKGDCRSFSIAAASIVAKVTRDRLMCQFDEKYSGYGFAAHKGYATPQHLQALEELGPCEIHRRSFSPIKTFFTTHKSG